MYQTVQVETRGIRFGVRFRVGVSVRVNYLNNSYLNKWHSVASLGVYCVSEVPDQAIAPDRAGVSGPSQLPPSSPHLPLTRGWRMRNTAICCATTSLQRKHVGIIQSTAHIPSQQVFFLN